MLNLVQIFKAILILSASDNQYWQPTDTHILFPMLNATKYKIHDILDRVIDIDWKFPMHGISTKKRQIVVSK